MIDDQRRELFELNTKIHAGYFSWDDQPFSTEFSQKH